MNFTKFGAVVLSIGALLHFTRIFVFQDLIALFPIWMSALGILVFGTLGYFYTFRSENILLETQTDKVFYWLSTVFFIGGLSFHLIRLSAGAQLFASLSMWWSYLVLPICAVLAYYNYRFKIRG